MIKRIVVLGAGQAAQSLIETLRKEGYEGGVSLVGAEPSPPYQRPPLSKAYLLGQTSVERLAFRPASFYADADVETRFAASAVEIDRLTKQVRLSTGHTLPYDKLALTTGARPRQLPASMGGDAPGVFTLRSLADADALAEAFTPGRRLIIIGGGYIGLEAAAVAVKMGLSVALLEREPRLLARVACAETASYFRDLHLRNGVDLRENAAAARFEVDTNGALAGVTLETGETLSADVALVGVGAVPNDELATSAGLATHDGVLVDDRCLTEDPDIAAAGDCARFPFHGAPIRLESVQNAVDQGAAAARALLASSRDAAPIYRPSPWFWSDQYDVKLQIAGLPQRGAVSADRTVVRPGVRAGAQSVWRFATGAGAPLLLSVDAMNDPKAYMTGKRWIEAGVSPDPERLADPSVDLKELA